MTGNSNSGQRTLDGIQVQTDGLFVAWHVGRQGEASCGMTQVVNGYLRWPFEHCRIGVIESLNGSSGLKAMVPFLRSVFTTLNLRDPEREMVVVHLSQGGSFVREGILLWLARVRGFGVVAHLHGSRFVDFAERWPGLVGKVLSSANKIIVLSAATDAKVKALVPNASTCLIPNAVISGRVASKEKRILFGGAVSRRKGVDVLLQAWDKSGTGKGWILTVAGPQDEEFRNLELAPDVEMPGAVSHQNLMQMLERSQIAVLPSRDEAMPMFILEAMARGNCVVSTRVGGIPGVLGDGTGVLLDAGNVDQLADAFAQLIENADLRERHAQLAQKKYEADYSANAVYGKLESLWASVLNP